MNKLIKKNLFLFDSLINDVNFYKESYKKYNFKQLEDFFLEIRQKSVDIEVNKNTEILKEIINNVQLTNVGKNPKERYEIAFSYFLKDFYLSPVYYAIHLLNMYNEEFRNSHVTYKGLNWLLESVKKYDTVILNGLHMDLYQVLLNYISILLPNHTLSLFGVEHSLKKIEEINTLYTPFINNIEYNYIDSLDDKPYPLAFKKAYRDVKEKKIILIPPEISMGIGSKIKTNLVGLNVNLPQGSSSLSCKFNIPVIITYVVRKNESDIQIFFEKPILPSQKNIKYNSEKESKIIFKKINDIINQYPDTWSGYDVINYMVNGVYDKEGKSIE